MKCPKCIAEGKTSKVYPGGSSVTLMGWDTYYDEDGKFHSHDPNWVTTAYRCSNDHNWTEKSKRPCLNCDYGKQC